MEAIKRIRRVPPINKIIGDETSNSFVTADLKLPLPTIEFVSNSSSWPTIKLDVRIFRANRMAGEGS